MIEPLVERLELDEAELAALTTRRLEETRPELFARYPANGRTRCREDTVHHVQHLAAALDIDDVDTFVGYRRWLDELLTARGIPAEDVTANLRALAEVVAERYGEDARRAVRFLEAAM